MFKVWAHRAWCLGMILIITASSTSSLQAHATSNSKAESVEAHRKTDFGFEGFEKLNKQLQKDFNNFNYAAAAAVYQCSLRMESVADAHILGQWSPVFALPVVPIHAVVLPDRKILIWDSVGDLPTEHYEVHNTTRAIIWDPATGIAVRNDVNTGFNLFCSGHAALPDGRQFIAGGNLNSNLSGLDKLHTFNSTNNSWTLLGQMSEGGRWYPSVTALASGEMLITSGGPTISEVYNPASGLRSLTTAVLEMPLYPWIQAAPNGNAFYFGPDNNLRYLNTSGSGAWQNLGGREGINRSYGSYAMYDAGKVLAAGGSNSVKNTVVIDFKSRRPQVTRAGDLNSGRRQHNLTVLPNGTVLATGGNSDGASLISLSAGVYTAELWNPATGNWINLAAMQKTRQYHSMALLLPDARVMVGGGGICGDCYDVGYLEKNIEIFSPPYLFKQDGSGEPAPRPSINAAPSEISYRQNFDISTENPKNIRQVVLIRPSSVTHSVNFEQRRIPLSFTVKRNGFQATAPSDTSIAPPGFYMMFIIDGNGVPSVAKMVKLS